MSGPLLLIGFPLLLSGIAWGIGRWRVAAWAVATGGAGLLALAALRLPLGEPLHLLGASFTIGRTLTVLGRPFTVELDQRPALMFLYLAGTFLFGGALPARPGRLFLPAGLASLGLLAAALFVQPFLFAAIFIVLVAALTAAALVDDDHPNPRGPLLYLIYMALGMPFALVAGWLIEGGSPAADPLLQGRLAVLIGAAFALWLAIVPFHSWVPLLLDESPPFAAAFVMVIVRGAILFFLLRFLNEYFWMRQNAGFLQALTLGGAGLALLGGGLAPVQQRLGRLMGYAVLVDIGTALAGIAAGSANAGTETGSMGIGLSLALIALRGLALGVWALGLTALRRAAATGTGESDSLERLRGFGRKMPLATAAVLLGGLSLVGFPLTAGFPTRWALLRLLAPSAPGVGLALLLAGAGVVLGYARFLAALFAPHPAEPAARPGVLEQLYLAAGVALILFLGAFPQTVLPAVTRAALSLRNLAP